VHHGPFTLLLLLPLLLLLLMPFGVRRGARGASGKGGVMWGFISIAQLTAGRAAHLFPIVIAAKPFYFRVCA
jgi:hypothetical protein